MDFSAFRSFIDTLSGVTVDVPKSFKDTMYPNYNNGYQTVRFASWVNQFNGERALEYARSRESTTDFDRSSRQQLIIKAVINKLISIGILNISQLKKLYTDYTTLIHTNISMNQMIRLSQYMYNHNNMFSYSFSTNCSNSNYKFSYPGCFIWVPDPSIFGWAYVVLPEGAKQSTTSFFDYTKNFASYIFHNQQYLIENPKIVILNGIDKKFARKIMKKSNWFAQDIAIKLKKYAFNVIDIENSPHMISGTTFYVVSTGSVNYTIKTLENFVPISDIVKNSNLSWIYQLSGSNQITWADIILVLGDDYASYLATHPCNYYK